MKVAREGRVWHRALVQLPLRRQEVRVSAAHPETEGPATNFRYRQRNAGEAGRPADRTSRQYGGVLRPQLERCDDRTDGMGRLETQYQAYSRGRDLDGDRLDIEAAAQSNQLGLDRCSRARGDERQAVEGRPHHLGIHAVRGPVRRSIGGLEIRAGEALRPGIDLAVRILHRPLTHPRIPARGRAIGCRRNCPGTVVRGSCSTPAAPLSRSVVPGHEQTLSRSLIIGSRDGPRLYRRVRPVRSAATPM